MSRPVLLRPRWLAGHLLALGLVVLFVTLGLWQLRRLDARTTHNELVLAREAAAPVALADLLAGLAPGDALPEYATVVVEGSFDPAREVLLRGRSLEGRPGFNVVTPLLLGDDGDGADTAVLVERGWVPYDHDTVPVADATPPSGDVVVTGRLRLPTSYAGGLAPRDPAEGSLVQTYYVNVARLQQQVPYALLPLYVSAIEVQPPHQGALPLPLPGEELSNGPHLGYAVQWFSFALVGIVGYAILLRSVRRQARVGGAAP